MRNSGVRFHEPFEQKWEKFEQHENYTLSSAGTYSLRRRVPNAIRPHSQNCYNNSRPIILEIFEPYRYVPPQSVGFLRRFGMTGIDFAHALWAGIGCGLRRNYDCVLMCSSFQFQMNERESEIYANSKWILRNLFDGVLISAMMTYFLFYVNVNM